VFAAAKERALRVEAEAGFARCGGGLRRAPPRAATGAKLDGRSDRPRPSLRLPMDLASSM